jgi:hypothetical protein
MSTETAKHTTRYPYCPGPVMSTPPFYLDSLDLSRMPRYLPSTLSGVVPKQAVASARVSHRVFPSTRSHRSSGWVRTTDAALEAATLNPRLACSRPRIRSLQPPVAAMSRRRVLAA